LRFEENGFEILVNVVIVIYDENTVRDPALRSAVLGTPYGGRLLAEPNDFFFAVIHFEISCV
jgi:hypothetical protein